MSAVRPSPQRLQELLEGFARVRLLVVGDLVLDEYVRGEVERVSPEAPVPVVQVQDENLVLGGAGNVVRNVVALGGKGIAWHRGEIGHGCGDRVAAVPVGIGHAEAGHGATDVEVVEGISDVRVVVGGVSVPVDAIGLDARDDRAQIGPGARDFGPRLRLEEVGHRDQGQNGDDRHDNQQLDQRKRTSCIHDVVSLFLAGGRSGKAHTHPFF